jgi:hypothetical protein
MDWQAAENGLLAWVSAMTGTPPALIAWDRAAVVMRTFPQIDLRFFDHRARDGMTPEVSYPPDPDDDGMLQPEVSAQRACSWSITVTTRDQRANGKAYVMLDRLAVMLELPYTAERFSALGLSILDMGRVIPNTDLPSDHRELSQAVLTLQVGYVTTVTVPDDVVPDGDVSVIEHVEVGGTAIDVTVPITIAPHIVPPLPGGAQ